MRGHRIWPAATALAGLLLLVAAAPPALYTVDESGLPANYPGDMDQAQTDYVEHCGGCHGIKGNAAPADLPNLQGRVGWFMCLPEGRDYLMRLPNIARSRITDNEQLADLMNFMVFGLGGKSTPAGTRPFAAAEVAEGRTRAFTSVSLVKTRAVIVEKVIQKCGAPASLRLMYPAGAERSALAVR
ncbi:cytochrome c family protein [Sandarakinorhabdus oryzae]|uniref:cytochrome C n=1 Tax=Sandarakinorhabdus oryzae TaxID=2675220 RepID=UPI001F2E7D98|nr:cytochrome C [Sandarakinorhabdus oryzae]